MPPGAPPRPPPAPSHSASPKSVTLYTPAPERAERQVTNRSHASAQRLSSLAIPPPVPEHIPDLKETETKKEKAMAQSTLACQAVDIGHDPFTTPLPQKVVRPRKVGGLRWWLVLTCISLGVIIIASMLAGGVGFAGGSALPEQCWRFAVNEFHERCMPPLMVVDTFEKCRMAQLYLTKGLEAELAVKEGDGTQQANVPAGGCYQINGVYTWDTYDTKAQAEHDYYPICQGSPVRQTEKCQEDWSQRITGAGLVLTALCILLFTGCCLFMCTCVNPPLARACGWSSRIGGTEVTDLINQPRTVTKA